MVHGLSAFNCRESCFLILVIIIIGIEDDSHFGRAGRMKVGVLLFLISEKIPIGIEIFIFATLSFIETANQQKEGIIMKKITRNAIRCNLCGDEIESKYSHDFRWCSCGGCAVDGGSEYLRRLYTQEGCFTDVSTFEEEDNVDE